VMRKVTERPEAVDAGYARIVGTDVEAIVRPAAELLGDAGAYARMVAKSNPFGDGHAGERIADVLRKAAP
jgi:UDP-N-acetylglucosamine 2-epimerase (non-hydrolysing)